MCKRYLTFFLRFGAADDLLALLLLYMVWLSVVMIEYFRVQFYVGRSCLGVWTDDL